MFRNNRGMTIVEVVVALAIIGIVGGSLLEMFIVSTKINKRALDVDRANVLAVSAAELFKKDPEGLAQTEMFGGGNTFNEENLRFTKYYNASWEELAAGSTPLYIPEGAKYKLLAEVIPEPEEAHVSRFYPEPVYEYTLDSSTKEYYLNISKAGLNYIIDINSTTSEPIYISEGQGVIPVKINYAGDGSTGVKINVTNRTEKEAALYIFDVPEGNMGGIVSVIPVEGPVSYSFDWQDQNAGTGENSRMYSLKVTVTRIEDGFNILEYSTKRYLVR